MSRLFGGLEGRANPFENPSIPLTDAGLLDFFGGTPTNAGVSVSEETSMRSMTVWRCVSLLSGLVAGLPLKVYRYSDKSEVMVRALRQPSPTGTSFELWETIMAHLLLWGNAYVHKVRNGAGSIVQLRPIHPSRVRTQITAPDADSDTSATKVFSIADKGGQEHLFTNFDVMHIPGLSFDGIEGLSPLGYARQAVAIGQAADLMAAKLFGNGAMLSGILTTDRILTQEQADFIKARWREKMTGVRHGHDVAVMDAGTKFQPISMPPEDAQFLQSRRWQTVEIARWFGIPPHLVGDVEKSTSWGTGIEQQNIGFVAYTVRGWLTRLEQRIGWEIVEPSTQYAEFLIDGLLRGATAERYAAYAQGIQWGWLTRNEARKKENLPPIDGLDTPLTPLNMAASAMGEQAVPGAGDPPSGEDDLTDQPDDPTNPAAIAKP